MVLLYFSCFLYKTKNPVSVIIKYVNFLPNNKVLDLIKLKEVADNQINLVFNIKLCAGRKVENFVEEKILVTSVFRLSHCILISSLYDSY